jgi:glucose/arabinose dehydrogenase
LTEPVAGIVGGVMRRFAALTLCAALLTACAGNNPPPSPRSSPASANPTNAAPTSGNASPITGTPDLSAEPTEVTGLKIPWGLAFLPDGDLLVSERATARILRVPKAGGQPKQVYKVPGVQPRGEGGLLGLALSPDFATDKYVYVYFTATDDNRIVRFKLGEQAVPQVIFKGLAKGTIHNGGRIAFGPDKLLYVGTGETGRRGLAQDRNSPNGKILRLTPEGRPAPGNPIPGSPIYSLGHRNVQGLAWDGAGRLFGVEFGQDTWDEVNLIEPGRNYGWPVVEGKGDTHGGQYTNPRVTWHTDDASPSGAAIAGNTLYVAALRGERLWVIPLNNGQTGQPAPQLQGTHGRLRTVAVAPDGALWIATSNTDGRGDPKPGDDRLLRFPAR